MRAYVHTYAYPRACARVWTNNAAENNTPPPPDDRPLVFVWELGIGDSMEDGLCLRMAMIQGTNTYSCCFCVMDFCRNKKIVAEHGLEPGTWYYIDNTRTEKTGGLSHDQRHAERERHRQTYFTTLNSTTRVLDLGHTASTWANLWQPSGKNEEPSMYERSSNGYQYGAHMVDKESVIIRS